MTDLASRVEAASGADRELDAEIAAAVRYFPRNVGFVWQNDLEPNVPEVGRVTCVTSLGTGGPHYAAPAYTASIDAALTLVPPGLMAAICRFSNGKGRAQLHDGRDIGGPGIDAFAATPALALCAAALRARKEQNDG